MNLTITSARFASLIGSAAIIVVSLVPGHLRPHLIESGETEHFVAYLGVALLFSLCIEKLRTYVVAGAALVTCAAIIEILQLWIPGRHPQFGDVLASGSGTLSGLAIGAALSATGGLVFKPAQK